MATDKIKTFNSIIESFLAQTSEIVGTTFYVYFKKVIKLNALIAIENGIKYVLPYREMIFNKNESYFTDEILSDKVNNDDKILSEIFRLKDIYHKLDYESIENVWSILQALVQLMIEYCEIKNITIPALQQ